MLNGAKAKATDNGQYSINKMDDENQVKVFVNYHGRKEVTAQGKMRETYNSKKHFEVYRVPSLDVSSKRNIYGLDCYNRKKSNGSESCFGHSTNSLVSGFELHIANDDIHNMTIKIQEFIYGGVKIKAFTHPKNINKAKEIDAAIWRLLAAWNIAPLPTDNKNN